LNAPDFELQRLTSHDENYVQVGTKPKVSSVNSVPAELSVMTNDPIVQKKSTALIPDQVSLSRVANDISGHLDDGTCTTLRRDMTAEWAD
jgi:hypothetical protein